MTNQMRIIDIFGTRALKTNGTAIKKYAKTH